MRPAGRQRRSARASAMGVGGHDRIQAAHGQVAAGADGVMSLRAAARTRRLESRRCRLKACSTMLLLTACHHYCPAGLVATAPAPSIRDLRLPAGPGQLKILTWNIWMMPWFTFQSPHNQKRARAIAEELLKL